MNGRRAAIPGVTLTTVTPNEYVREVLPETQPLWGGPRDFARYEADFRAVAQSAYGRSRPFTVGMRDAGRLVVSCKLYDREMRWGTKTLRATGIGAVFTIPAHRGRGFASAMLGVLLDEERVAGRDIAFLYSDIHPAFYERLGFIRLPSRNLTLRAASLDGSHSGAAPLGPRDWPGLRRCFEELDGQRPWTLARTPLVWEWLRRMWSSPPPASVQRVQLVVRHKREIVTYVIGRRVLREDSFVVDDFAFAGDAGRARLSAVLRAAAGDLRRVSAWLPPPIARDALPRGSVRVRRDGIFMVAPLSAAARAWWKSEKDEILGARSDATWAADHV
jgi:GNAT superfamily N-acetyltransferase